MTTATAPPRPPAVRRRRRRLVVALVVMGALVAVVTVVALVLLRPGLYMSTPNLEIVDAVGGDAEPGTVGAAFPALSGTDYDGAPTSFDPVGSPAAVVLVAHWCHYCQDETRALARAMTDGTLADPSAVHLVATQHMRFTDWPPEEALGLEDYPGNVLVDTNSALATRLRMRGTPTWYFTGADGVIREVVQGTLTPAEVDEHLRRAGS
jgi:hypothetical protein